MKKTPCPCHSGLSYDACCQPLHLGTPALNAENLMRARYSAYVLKLKDFLLDTWDEKTRPALTMQDFTGIKWLGLTILDFQAIDTSHATVTFEATFKSGQGKHQVLHECSEFIFHQGRWFYLQAQEP